MSAKMVDGDMFFVDGVIGGGSRRLERYDFCWGLGVRHRLQASMTRATVEDSTARLGQTLCTRRPLVGGLSFHGRLGEVHDSRGTQVGRRNSGPKCTRHRCRCRPAALPPPKAQHNTHEIRLGCSCRRGWGDLGKEGEIRMQ